MRIFVAWLVLLWCAVAQAQPIGPSSSSSSGSSTNGLQCPTCTQGNVAIVNSAATGLVDSHFGIFLENVCAGSDDSGAINTALGTLRTFANASITNSAALLFPNGAKCVVTQSLNFTGFTNQNLTVYGNGAEIYAAISQSSLATGPIGLLASLAGGSSYTNGTYYNVALTGGTGTGAAANFVVSGGAVSAVTRVKPGIGYVSNDSLSVNAADIGGTGTGFTISVSTLGAPVIDALGSLAITWENLRVAGDQTHPPNKGIQYGRTNTTALNSGGGGMHFTDVTVGGYFYDAAVYNFSAEEVIWDTPHISNSFADPAAWPLVQDGYNYFGVTSAFVTESAPVDTPQSFSLNTFIGGNIKALGSGNVAAVFFAGGSQHKYINSYFLNNAGANCVEVYNLSTVTYASKSVEWNGHCEGTTTDYFLVTGPFASPIFYDWTISEAGIESSNSLLKLGQSVASPVLQGVNLRVAGSFASVANTLRTFDAPASWSVTGSVYTQPSFWNAPLTFSGFLNVGNVTSPGVGPIDLLGSAAGAYSCARRLSQTYLGALCNVERTSDSTTIDLYPNANGDLDPNAFTLFCNGATCKVATWYDQSGNSNNATQGTVGNQPTLTLSLTALNHRAALQFGDAGAVALSVTQSASINGVFGTGGYMTAVIDSTGTPSQPDRIVDKAAWTAQYIQTGQTTTEWIRQASTTVGTWTAPSLSTGAHLYDVRYNEASLSNVPVIGYDGVSQTLGATQPVGTPTTDNGNMIVGNNATTGGTRGFPGYIAELILWKTTPSTNTLDAIRRNQAAYYGLSTVQ